MVHLDQLLLDTLGHTAHHTDNQLFLLFTQRLEVLQSPVNLLLSVITHGAGVHKDRIGLLDLFRQRIAIHLHDRGHHLAIRHIHLATIRLDK